MMNPWNLSVLLLGLCLSAHARAQAGITFEVKTDMDCYWKLDGRPMGLLHDDDDPVVPVSPGEHLIQARTTDGVVRIRATVKVDKGRKIVRLQLQKRHDQQVRAPHPQTAREPAEAGAGLTWTDPATGLMWTKGDNGSDVSWNQAVAYCSNLQLAGSSGWRLPTIDELQGIDDPTVSAQTGFDFGASDVHVKGKLKLTGWSWSSSQGSQGPWNFNFQNERATDGFPLGFSYNMRALCVHPSGESVAKPELDRPS